MAPDLYLTTDEAATLLRFDVTHQRPRDAFAKWAKANQIVLLKRGKRRLVLKAAVIEALHRSPRPRLRRVS